LIERLVKEDEIASKSNE